MKIKKEGLNISLNFIFKKEGRGRILIITYVKKSTTDRILKMDVWTGGQTLIEIKLDE